MRKYAMIQILQHLSEFGSTSAIDLYEALHDLDIPQATFYRALRELVVSGAVLKRQYEMRSGKRYTKYRINVYTMSYDERRNH